ncbi:MAG: preprotein translocase subunit SecA [Planctomycetaceae bacterium]|nr:preprotein translocase subunit SecA [Planctomycetaceae bacterium]
MDLFDRVGDFFTSATEALDTGIRRMFGSSNEREIRRIGFLRGRDGNTQIAPGSILDRIQQFEPAYEKLTDAELKQTAEKMRARLRNGETLDDILPEVFAAARESGKRYLKMRHYDVQMVGGYILHTGRIAEMMTGEGKTLVATLPAALNAMAGHVHLVTVNDYLAKRDMEWMGPLYMGLGLTVGAIQGSMAPHERQPSYACDITYGTNNEFGFDYLRDNLKKRAEHQVQGPLDYAIVDEIDNILIDEARTPLIISGPAFDDVTRYPVADRIARQLVKDVHFEVKEKEHTCHLTEEGIRRAEELAGVESFYTSGNMEWPHLIDNALKAHHLYKRDVSYVVEGGQVVIVDEHTGRKMEGRQWSDGLHQAVEAKEGVKVKEVSQTYATVTLQNYFKMYKKLCGMTGTAMTEANEFYKIYGLDVIEVPTNRPTQRINHQDVIFRTEREKWHAVVDEIVEVHKQGRPVLVGTVSIEKSEKLKSLLDKKGVKCELLNAKHHAREAEIVAQAGRLNAVTISTNMAGRGTDIILGGNPEQIAWDTLKTTYASRLDIPKSEWEDLCRQIAEREGMKAEGRKVAEIGGLHVVGTERHDSRRIDLQLRGRAGRQGDPGSSRFFLSLEDDLMRIFAGDKVKAMLTWLGMQEGEAIEHSMVTKQVEKAQKRVEERHFEARRNLLEYDEVMDHQRKEVYAYRQRILDGANVRDLMMGMIDQQVEKWASQFLSEAYRWETAAAFGAQHLGITVDASDVRDMTLEQMRYYLLDEANRQGEMHIYEQLEENLPDDVDQRDWNWQALAGWANRQFHLNLNDRELRKIAREGSADENAFNRDALVRFLTERAEEMLSRTDFSPLEVILADNFGQQQLSGYLRQQFGVEITPEDLSKIEDPQDAIAVAQQKVRDQYRDREIRFPVLVGLNRFMSRHQDREGLIAWANQRFETHLTDDDFKEKERQQVIDLLIERATNFYPDAETWVEFEQRLDGAFDPESDISLPELATWAKAELEIDLNPDDLAGMTVERGRARVMQIFSQRYRPEFSQVERDVLLELLDNGWKGHLYGMDLLRSGIGLVGYAQKDPKVEYKRAGMAAFDEMWVQLSETVTSTMFRVESQSSAAYLDDLWANASAHHDQAMSAAQEARLQMESGGEGEDGDAQAVETIRNFEEKVGRNDPCPCGSGKKYKKCHGA